jgi:hypothetical protein
MPCHAMNKKVIIAFLILFSLKSSAQNNNSIKVHPIRESITINLDELENNFKESKSDKIHLMIFEKFDSTKYAEGPLLSYITKKNLLFDKNIFLIEAYYYHQDSGVQVCKLESEIYFVINGIKNKIPNKMPVLYIYGNNDSINQYRSSGLFQNLILKPSFLYLSKQDIAKDYLLKNRIQISEPLDQRPTILARIAELEDKLNKIIIRKDTTAIRLFGISTQQYKKVNLLMDENISNLDCYMDNLQSVEISRTKFKYGRKSQIGILGALNYKSFTVNSTISDNANNTLIDNLGNKFYDPNGENFYKVVYGHILKDQVSIKQIGFKFGLAYKINTSKKGNSFITISPSVEINSLLSAFYQAKEGSISIGGIYPQYNPSDTMFNNLYGFSQGNKVSNSKYNFNAKASSFNYNLDVSFYLAPIHELKNFYLNLGIRSSFSSNLLNPYASANKLSDNLNTYNALLYRANSLKYFALGLNIGITYKL